MMVLSRNVTPILLLLPLPRHVTVISEKRPLRGGALGTPALNLSPRESSGRSTPYFWGHSCPIRPLSTQQLGGNPCPIYRRPLGHRSRAPASTSGPGPTRS